MKRKTITMIALIVCIFFTGAASAGVSLDLKGGVNVSHQWGDDVPDGASLKFGAIGGVGVGIKLHKIFAVQPEGLITVKGYKITEGNQETQLKLSYLEIPLLLKLYIPAGKVLPNFYVGPALDLLVGAYSIVPRGGIDNEEDIKDKTKPLDVCAVAGGGLDIKAGPSHVIIEIRYTMGFLTTSEPIEELGEEIEQTTRNGAFSFILGYGVNLGGD